MAEQGTNLSINQDNESGVDGRSLGKGNNPTGKGGFADNPDNINVSGKWKKEDTPRFKLEQMMKLGEPELKKIYDDVEAPLFERKMARAIYDGNWGIIQQMINQVYGTPKQTVDIPNMNTLFTNKDLTITVVDPKPVEDISPNTV